MIRQGLDSAGTLESGDNLGWAVAAGDFDGDGYDDLAMGAPLENVFFFGLDRTNAGAVVISRGSPFGLTHEGAVFRTGGSIGWSSETGAEFGFALASGDFNNDTYDDLAIGAPYDPVGDTNHSGRVYVLDGSPTGLAETALVVLTQVLAGGNTEENDEFGYSLAVADFNGDGFDDLAVGAPGEDTGAGAIFHFYGSPAGLTGDGAGWFKQSQLGGSNTPGDRFGHAMAANGDLYGTPNHDDLAVGAPQRSVSGNHWAGVVYLLQGGFAGLSVDSARVYNASGEDMPQADAFFANTLAIGKFSSNPRRFLAIGEPGRTVNGHPNAGRVIVVRSDYEGLNFADTDVLTQGGPNTACEEDDRFGFGLATGKYSQAGVFDDLAVGSPSETIGSGSDEEAGAGLVQIFFGSVSGLSTANSQAWQQDDLCDKSISGDWFGYSVTFGNFDDSGRSNLAIGTPKQDDDEDSLESTPIEEDAGCVFVLADWRQVTAIPSRCAVAYDINDNLVLSQRPFDRMRPASTTKVMTALVAIKHTELPPTDPGYVDLTDEYIIPSWVANCTMGGNGGSCPSSFVEDERMTLKELLARMIALSDNCAAYAIGDLVSYNGTADSLEVCDFVYEMNSEAWSLGMNSTHFSNPAGRDNPPSDCEDHYSTAADMAILAREAMNHGELANITKVQTWYFNRFLPTGEIFGIIQADTVVNSCMDLVNNRIASADMAKSGNTTDAGKCVLLGWDNGVSIVVGGLYGMPQERTAKWPGGGCRNLSCALLRLARNRTSGGMCPAGYPTLNVVDEKTLFDLSNLSSALDSVYVGVTEIEIHSDTLSVELTRSAGMDSASVHLSLSRGSRLVLGGSESAELRIAPFDSHDGFRIHNSGANTATIQVTQSEPFTVTSHSIAPEDFVDLPPYTGGTLLSDFTLTVDNLYTDSVEVGVTEKAYNFITGLSPPGGAVEAFCAELIYGPNIDRLWVSVRCSGLDANLGNEVRVTLREGKSVLIGVGPHDRPPPANRIVHVRNPLPNPFGERTAIEFDLFRAGRVNATVYDVNGRKIRNLGTRKIFPGTWRFEWDGRGEDGEPVATGVYFVRVSVNGRAGGEKKVLLLR